MFKATKNICVFIMVILFSACAVGPDYVKPTIDTPKAYGVGKDNKNFKVDKFDATWWEYFKDDELTRLINEAIAGSKNIQIALSRVNENRALVGEAFAGLLPETHASYIGTSNEGYGKEKIMQSPVPAHDYYTSSIDASWEIDIFGRLRRKLESREAELDASVASLNDTLRMLVADVADSYFSLRGSQERLKIAKKNIKIQQDTLDIVTAKFNAGQVSELDKVQAESQLEMTKASIPPLETAVKVNMHRLAVLSGRFPLELEERLKVEKALTIYQGPVNISNASELLKTRPDVIEAERNLAALTAQIGVAKADYFPRVSILGSLSLETDKLAKTFHNGMTGSLGPSISWTPFDFGRIRANVKASEARVEGALANYENTVLRAFEDVENALTSFTHERKRYATLDKSFKLSQKSYQLALDQYREGALDFISVLSVQTDMLTSENNLSKSREALNESIVSIYKSLGGGWNF